MVSPELCWELGMVSPELCVPGTLSPELTELRQLATTAGPRRRAPVPATGSGEPLGTDAEPGPSLSDGVRVIAIGVSAPFSSVWGAPWRRLDSGVSFGTALLKPFSSRSCSREDDRLASKRLVRVLIALGENV